MSEITLLAELEQRRGAIFDDLRDREPELIAKLLELDAAIAGMKAEAGRVVRNDEYAHFRKPSEALFTYLDRVQKGQVKEQMCRALVNGGYGGGEEDQYWILIRSADYQIGKKRLIEKNGLVGKPGWPKALFEG